MSVKDNPVSEITVGNDQIVIPDGETWVVEAIVEAYGSLYYTDAPVNFYSALPEGKYSLIIVGPVAVRGISAAGSNGIVHLGGYKV